MFDHQLCKAKVQHIPLQNCLILVDWIDLRLHNISCVQKYILRKLLPLLSKKSIYAFFFVPKESEAKCGKTRVYIRTVGSQLLCPDLRLICWTGLNWSFEQSNMHHTLDIFSGQPGGNQMYQSQRVAKGQ